ncbi:putative secretion ATPase, PEP-CTERM locus subfamily [Desulfonatronum zhilinae]|nr:putative secretion ATPase, PEP-CTERM locus subfamily [Desulfonatronum zhilinae]
MYEDFFGLRVKPFDLLPNPEFLFQSKSHRRAMTYLDYGIKDRSGFILITGEVGSGKTTIIRDLIKKKLDRVVLSKVFNTKVSSEQLISMINDDFGLPVQGKDKIVLLRELNEFLIHQFAKNMQPVLIIDEAQNLSPELLEEVRMLSNLETDQAKLLQIILVGQPELKKVLAAQEMLQLRQRININCHIQPLCFEETEKYILHRLEIAGGRDAARFSSEALALIHAQSRGVPRLINIICDYLMLSMYSEQTRDMDGKTAQEIIKELDFEQQFWDVEARKPEPCPDRIPGETSGEFQRTKVKLSLYLRDIVHRLELLEKNSEKYGEDLLLGIHDRMNDLEASMTQHSLQFEILAEEISNGHSRNTLQETRTVTPAEAEKSRLALADVKQPEKGFLRGMFGGQKDRGTDPSPHYLHSS